MWQSTNRRVEQLIEFAICEHLLIDLLRKEIGITHWNAEAFFLS
jgi:hypothetical protein